MKWFIAAIEVEFSLFSRYMKNAKTLMSVIIAHAFLITDAFEVDWGHARLRAAGTLLTGLSSFPEGPKGTTDAGLAHWIGENGYG